MVDSVAYAAFDKPCVSAHGDGGQLCSYRVAAHEKKLRMIQASLAQRGIIIDQTPGLKSKAIFMRRIRDEIRAANATQSCVTALI